MRGSEVKGSIVDSVSQVSLRIDTIDAEATFASIRKEVLLWLYRKAGRKPPQDARDGKVSNCSVR